MRGRVAQVDRAPASQGWLLDPTTRCTVDLWLGIATVLEVAFALGTNVTKGFTRLWPSVFTLFAAVGSLFILSLALRDLDVGIGYTIWTGLGATGTVLLGALIFGEKITLRHVGSFALIILGVIGLRLTGV